MKKILIALTLLMFSATSFAITPAQQLQNLLNSISSMQANFSQKTYTSKGKGMRASSGTMALQKPGLFRWTVTSPRNVILVSNGKLLWIYDKSLKQVSVSNAKKAAANSPAIVLSNRIRLLSNYFIVFEKNGWYILNTRYKNDMIKQVQLKFAGQKLVQMNIFDNLGQRSMLYFNNMRINQSLSSSQFNFQIPKGVDVVR